MTNLARASAWMALGTIVSRLTGFGRLLLLAATIGTSLNADLFNGANTIPNALYIVVAGGIFNVVLVPQLVRTMKLSHAEGDAYANRVITLGLLVLGVATVVLTAMVPLITRVVFDQQLFAPENVEQRQSAELLMYLCMPQVFFYGAFVLIGQVLNARGRFGPMMWAPIVNNVIALAVLAFYLAIYGASNGTDGFTTSQAVLLGVGSTIGIVAQAVALLPYFRSVGFTYKPRFDFRSVGLGHTFKLGMWTLLFILANQAAYIVIQRLGTRGTLAGAASDVQAAGAAVYEIGFLVSQVPHGVITVSLATAIMPTLASLAAEGRSDRVRLELARTLRVSLTIIAPLAVAVACLSHWAAGAIAFGALRDNASVVGNTVAAFSPAMIAFTIHYIMLRGFYARENTRTPFFLQLVVAGVNIAVAVTWMYAREVYEVSTALALSYGAAYIAGAVISAFVLSRQIGPIVDREMVIFAGKLLASCGAAAAAMLALDVVVNAADRAPHTPLMSAIMFGIGGAAGMIAYVAVARSLRMEQLAYVVSSLRRR